MPKRNEMSFDGDFDISVQFLQQDARFYDSATVELNMCTYDGGRILLSRSQTMDLISFLQRAVDAAEMDAKGPA